MKKEAIALLLGYLKNQNELIDKILNGIKSADTSGEEKTVYLGYLLHNLYCAFEDLFQEIARTFENRLEDPSKYHRELLKRMAIEIPKIRPKVLSPESFQILDQLRGFRYVFRHSYMYKLSADKVAALKKNILEVWDKIESDIAEFEIFLEKYLETRQITEPIGFQKIRGLE